MQLAVGLCAPSFGVGLLLSSLPCAAHSSVLASAVTGSGVYGKQAAARRELLRILSTLLPARKGRSVCLSVKLSAPQGTPVPVNLSGGGMLHQQHPTPLLGSSKPPLPVPSFRMENGTGAVVTLSSWVVGSGLCACLLLLLIPFFF